MIEAQKIAGALGAEIHGVDLSRHSDPYMALARTMGESMEYPFLKGLPGHPEITQVAKFERERANFGGVWHSDTTYLEIPPMGSMLLAREVPAGRQRLHYSPISTWPTKRSRQACNAC